MESKGKRTSSINTNIALAAVFFGTAVLIFIVISSIMFGRKDTIIRWGGEYEGEWTCVLKDGSRESVKLPHAEETDINNPLVLETILPQDINPDCILSILTYDDTYMYVDGQLIAFVMPGNGVLGNNVKKMFLQAHILPEYAGKTLSLELRSEEKTTRGLYKVYYGDSLGLFTYMVKTYGGQFLLASVLLLLSVLIMLSGGYMAVIRQGGSNALLFGLGYFLISAWLISDSYLLQYLTGIYYVDGIWGYLLSMIAFMPFIAYLNRKQEYRYRRLYAVVQIMLIVDFAIMTVMHFTNIADFDKTRVIMNGFLILTIIGIILTMIVDAVNNKIKGYKSVYIGLVGLGILAIVDMVVINFFHGSKDGLFLTIGLYFLLILTSVGSVRGYAKDRIVATEAMEATRLKSAFLTNVSHNLRTPLNVILGMGEMILNETREPATSGYAVNIKTAGEQLLTIVDDLLDLSKAEAGEIEIVENEYDLANTIAEIVNMEEIQAESKGLELRVNVDSFLPKTVVGDEKHLRQILTNLISKGIKYTEEGYVELSVTGSRSYNQVSLNIRVEDTGCGISEEARDNLLKQFSSDFEGPEFMGSSLGLSITAQIVAKMNGKLYFDSIPGKGSVFTVEITQGVVGTDVIDDFQRRRRSNALANDSFREVFTAPEAKVLVVDDNLLNITVTKGLLKRSCVQVDSVLSGKEMLEAITKKHYDIIFLDHMMPEMNGIETLKKSKNLEGNLCLETPIIAMTANAMKGAKEQYLHVGFDGYIAKPIDLIKLESLISKFLPNELIVKSYNGDNEESKREDSLISNTVLVRESEGLANCADDIDFYHEVLRVFVDEFAEKAAQLNGHYNNADLANYRIAIHSLKSSARVVGAVELAELAKTIEFAAKQGRTEVITEKHDTAMKLYSEVVSYIEANIL